MVECPDVMHVCACVIVLMETLQWGQEQDGCVEPHDNLYLIQDFFHLLLIFCWTESVRKGQHFQLLIAGDDDIMFKFMAIMLP